MEKPRSSKNLVLIVGLGNPGEKYRYTWHNLGFLAVDEFQKKNNFPDFVVSQKFHALVSESVLDDKKIILAKPLTFMNESGQSVKKLLDIKYKIQNTNLIIIHDDADLPLGSIRISKDRGHAGHKGVKSIIKELKTKNFIRLRIGLRSQKGKAGNIVLKGISKKDEKIAKEIIEKASETISVILKEGSEKAMTKFN